MRTRCLEFHSDSGTSICTAYLISVVLNKGFEYQNPPHLVSIRAGSSPETATPALCGRNLFWLYLATNPLAPRSLGKFTPYPSSPSCFELPTVCKQADLNSINNERRKYSSTLLIIFNSNDQHPSLSRRNQIAPYSLPQQLLSTIISHSLSRQATCLIASKSATNTPRHLLQQPSLPHSLSQQRTRLNPSIAAIRGKTSVRLGFRSEHGWYLS